MTASGVESRPSDLLLAWLSARGRASRPTVERACRAIAERFDPRGGNDRDTVYRSIAPLRRIGHVEAVAGGFAVVPTALCWASQAGRGLFVGARDGSLGDALRHCLGRSFLASHADAPWPATWGVDGDRGPASEVVEELGIDMIQEPGMQVLESLPTLEDAVAAWPDAERPSDLSAWEGFDPGRGRWKPASGASVVDGLVRCTHRRPRAWMIARAGAWRRLDSPEKRAVAWWAELARQVRPRLIHHRGTGRLVLPASVLPPPVMVERPLIWASAGPPVRGANRGWIYEAVEPERAGEVARVLGLPKEDAS